MKLTIRNINAIPTDPSADIYIWDDKVAGFGLRVKPTGVRSFILQYRNASGVSRRMTLGKLGILTPEEARKLAKEKLEEVAKGNDPAGDRTEQRRAMTVKQLCATYIDAVEKGLIIGKRGRSKKRSTLCTDRGRIDRHIIPLLGTRKVHELALPDINRFMRDVASGKTAADIKTRFRGRAIVKGGPGTAARTVGLLGGILSFAVSEGIIPTNPARGVKRPKGQRREVRLSDEQYAELGKALTKAQEDREPATGIIAIKLLALTGCRRGEIQQLRWSEVDLDGNCLRLADSKEGSSIRPLGQAAREILLNLKSSRNVATTDEIRAGEDYVLSSPASNKPYANLANAWWRIMMNAQANTEAKHKLPDNLTPHGLRHAFASIASDLGFTEPTIAAMLGHAMHSTTSRYIHHLDAALIAAADRVSEHIQGAMNR